MVVKARGLLMASSVLVACLTVFPAAAQTKAEVDQKRAELDALQQRIRALESDISSTRSSHGKETAAMAEAERAVSQARRSLRDLNRQRATAERELAAAEAGQREVEARIKARREELSSLLRRHYMHGRSDVAPLLAGGDPNQIARDAHYMEHLGRARLELIDGLRADQREQERLGVEAAERRDRLVALEETQKREQAELEKVLARRASMVAKLAGELRGQEGAMSSLREDQEQLGRVIQLLQQQAARQAAEAAAAKAKAAATPRAPSSAPGRVDTGPLAEAARGGAAFRTMRGKLGFPVSGELAGRFGAQRGDGGTRWRGLFIRAKDGAEVRAVAAGEVVFSDWLRGYGNIIIVDHGEDYLTIYANNDALLRVAGDRVMGGESIASVGASGGVPESGLYFELRHKGEPIDPLVWMRSR